MDYARKNLVSLQDTVLPLRGALRSQGRSVPGTSRALIDNENSMRVLVGLR